MIDIDFEEKPITLEEVVSILGQPLRKRGDNYEWKCPACPNGDKSRDNLKFSETKHIIKCFACDFGQEVTAIIARRRFEKAQGNEDDTPKSYEFERKAPTISDVPEPPKVKEIPQNELSVYYWSCHVALMQRRDILKKMWEKHTILPRTATECMIGYDPKKDMLVFPSTAIGADPTQARMIECEDNGAEYREYEGEKKVRRISGYEPRICRVWNDFGGFTMCGILCEGYKDAYNLYQLLKMIDPERLSYTAIFTVQNGTNSINTNGCLQKVNWKRFDEMGILMDNDTAGDHATEVAQDLFPKFVDLRPKYLNGLNDVQKVFKENYADQVDIDRAINADWIKDYDKEEILWKW